MRNIGNVIRVAAPVAAPKQKKRYGILAGGVIRKRLDEEDLPNFWAGERQTQFPLALRCRDGWQDEPLELDEWLFGSCPVALIHAAFPEFQILVDTVGDVLLHGLPSGVETWDLFDDGLCVNPSVGDKDIAILVAEAAFLALRKTVDCGVEALVSFDLSELIQIIHEIKEEDNDNY